MYDQLWSEYYYVYIQAYVQNQPKSGSFGVFRGSGTHAKLELAYVVANVVMPWVVKLGMLDSACGLRGGSLG